LGDTVFELKEEHFDTIDITKFPSGIYTVVVKDNVKSRVIRLVKL
jgi:hypothetical protein